MSLFSSELFGNSIVILQTLAILLLSLALARRWRMGQRQKGVFRQWNERQTVGLSRSIDTLRDGSMQELFALRRSLELAALNPANTSEAHYQAWIQQLESLHIALNEWIESVSPSFSEESLPLAIASYLNQLRSSEKSFEFSIKTMKGWEPSDHACVNKTILIYFEGMKDAIGSPNGFNALELSFMQGAIDKTLQIELKQRNLLFSPEICKKAFDLSYMISFLAKINCRSFMKGNSLCVEFKWAD